MSCRPCAKTWQGTQSQSGPFLTALAKVQCPSRLMVKAWPFFSARELKANGGAKDEIKAAVAALNAIKDKIEKLVCPEK